MVSHGIQPDEDVTLLLLSTGFESGVILAVAQRSAIRTKNSSHVIFSFRPPLPQALTGWSLVYPIQTSGRQDTFVAQG